MSTAKRARRRQAEAQAASPAQPASKRLKTAKNSHVPTRGGLDFLVDEERRDGKKLEARLTNGVPSSKATRVDDSHAVIAPSENDVSKVGASQDNALEISSAESSSSDEESEEGDDEDEREQPEIGLVNGHAGGEAEDVDPEADAVAGAERMDITQQAPSEAEGENEEFGEPSFGDLLRTRHPEQIDVRASFPDPMADRQTLIHSSSAGALAIPPGTSLVTVLTQALKTNDKDQLELCLQQGDIPTIRATVQRLQSQHVASLLQRVAERVYKRPGRTGSLLVWIQWSLVAHGAYLATQSHVMAKLRALSRVLNERSTGLQPLLHMKGKLDMLSAQLDMRKGMQAASRARSEAEDEDDDEGVIYVEGQGDDDWSDDEDAVAGASIVSSSMKRAIEPSPSSNRPHLQNPTPNTDPAGSDGSSDDDMPNGVVQEADEESSDAEEGEEEGMFDVEAEETSDNEDEEADSSEDDSEPESESEVSDGDDSDGSEGVKPPDPALLSRKR